MKKVANALKNYVVDALLMIALGVVMLIWPDYSLKIIFTWVGIGFIVMGAIKGLVFFTKKEKEDRNAVNLLVGLIQIAVGILAVAKSQVLVEKSLVVMSVLLGYGAVVMIIRSLRIRKESPRAFSVCLVLGMVTLVLALVVFFNPAFLADLIMQVAGISLIFEGVSLFVVLSRKTNGGKEVR